MSQLTNKEMLQFIHDRMIHVHGDNENADFMHGLRRVMKAMEAAEARVAELAGLARRAYGEGYADAVTHVPNSVEDMRASWRVSSARKALNTGENDG